MYGIGLCAGFRNNINFYLALNFYYLWACGSKISEGKGANRSIGVPRICAEGGPGKKISPRAGQKSVFLFFSGSMRAAGGEFC